MIDKDLTVELYQNFMGGVGDLDDEQLDSGDDEDSVMDASEVSSWEEFDTFQYEFGYDVLGSAVAAHKEHTAGIEPKRSAANIIAVSSVRKKANRAKLSESAKVKRRQQNVESSRRFRSKKKKLMQELKDGSHDLLLQENESLRYRVKELEAEANEAKVVCGQ
jgi:hypothetical protein